MSDQNEAVKSRFEAANAALREQKISHLFETNTPKGDPNWRPAREGDQAEAVVPNVPNAGTISDPRLRQQIAIDNQKAQMQQRRDIMAATKGQTVQKNDIAGAQPVFVQQNPDDPVPVPVDVPPTPQTVGFYQPQPQRHHSVEGEQIVEKQEFMEPQGIALDQESTMQAMSGMRIRNPTEIAAQAANLLGFKKARLADPPIKIDPNTDYRNVVAYQPQIEGSHFAGTPEHLQPQGITPPQQVAASIHQATKEINRGAFPENMGNVFRGPLSATQTLPDLNKAVLDAVAILGESEAASYFHTSVAIIRKWIARTQLPNTKHLQILLNDPEAHKIPEVRSAVECFVRCNVETGDYFFTGGRPKVPVMIGMCVKGDISQAVHWAHMFLLKHWDCNYGQKGDTIIDVARNQIVDWFLETTNEYLLMLDSDVIPPIGNAEWFRDHTKWVNCRETSASFDIMQRLLGHGKDFVGGSYAGRASGMPMINQSDLNPRPGTNDKEVAARIRKGQARGLIEQEWVPGGCMMIRRNVFEAIKKRFPNLAPKGKGQFWGWFDHDHTVGEDVAFCRRARESGHKIYLDTELICGHIGKYCYGPGDAEPVRVQSL